MSVCECDCACVCMCACVHMDELFCTCAVPIWDTYERVLSHTYE